MCLEIAVCYSLIDSEHKETNKQTQWFRGKVEGWFIVVPRTARSLNAALLAL